MLGKNLFEAVKRIHKHLTDIEREYTRKGIYNKIRSDWGYAFYTGKLVAYIFILKTLKYKMNPTKDLEQRLLNLGIEI